MHSLLTKLSEEDVLVILDKCDAIKTGSHFVYSKPEGHGDHGSDYVNKDAIYVYPDIVRHLCHEMALRLQRVAMNDRSRRRFVVVGPEKGGIMLQSWLGYWLKSYYGGDIKGVYAEKRQGGGFELRRGYADIVKGATVIVVEDILNSGGSAKETISAVRAAGGETVGVVAICNRGGVDWKDLGVAFVNSLVDLKLEKYPEGDCPLCKAGRPIRTDLGHGREFLARRAQTGW